MELPYSLRSGKNIKMLYYAKSIALNAMPHTFFPTWQKIWKQARQRPDYDYILSRVNYYCRAKGNLGDSPIPINRIRKRDAATVYYYDLMEAMRPFPSSTCINFLPGDITYVPQVASLTKSRPISEENANSVLLKFNKIRHFIHPHDRIPYLEKKDLAIFRGKVPNKPKRERFFNQWYGNPLLNLGDTSRNGNPAWHTHKMSIAEQLRYKFILSLEGNEVASNLKWIMSSNSCAVMPEPEYETWFMEGTLKPGVHYIRISRDYEDLPEVLDYYIHNPQEAQHIVANANKYSEQFYDNRRERIISTLTVAKYLGLIE